MGLARGEISAVWSVSLKDFSLQRKGGERGRLLQERCPAPEPEVQLADVDMMQEAQCSGGALLASAPSAPDPCVALPTKRSPVSINSVGVPPHPPRCRRFPKVFSGFPTLSHQSGPGFIPSPAGKWCLKIWSNGDVRTLLCLPFFLL